jgi:hypothetical protein
MAAEHETEWRARLRHRRRTMVLAVVAVVAGVALVAIAATTTTLVRGWWTWQAPIQINGGRVMTDGEVDSAVFPVDAEDGSLVYRVAYQDGGELSVEVSFSSTESVTITDVEFPTSPILRPIDVMFSQEDDGTDLVYGPLRPFDPAVFVNDAPMPSVRGRFAFRACGLIGPDGSTEIDHVRVTYEARNRTRALDVAINPVVITAPADGCS